MPDPCLATDDGFVGRVRHRMVDWGPYQVNHTGSAGAMPDPYEGDGKDERPLTEGWQTTKG